MAKLSAHEIWAMSEEELQKNLDELQGEYLKIRGILASGGMPENIGRARHIRKVIARLKTIQHLRSKEIINPPTPLKSEPISSKNTTTQTQKTKK